MADSYEREKAKKKERYRELKSKGICTWCKKEKATPGFTSCKICREKERIRAQVYRSGKTTDTLNGICEEVTKYNEEHGTNYSYGYYSALKFRGLTGEIKKGVKK